MTLALQIMTGAPARILHLMPPVACARAAHRDSGDRLKENNMAHGPVLDTRLLLDGFGMGSRPGGTRAAPTHAAITSRPAKATE
jgi:hypothetical protein